VLPFTISWQQRAIVSLPVDCFWLTRGGGSLEDLWAFNELELATAVHECRTPVVAAIGHASDVTLVELVADARAETPTAAAMVLLPDREECRVRLGLVSRAMSRAGAAMVQVGRNAIARQAQVVRHKVLASVHRLAAPVLQLERRLHATRPDVVLQRRRQELELLRHRLGAGAWQAHRQGLDRLGRLSLATAAARTLERSRGHVQTLDRALQGVDPQAVLARGYSLTLNALGEVIRSASQVADGEVLLTRTGDGKIRSRVEPG
jgi:exodeoxyribonuclease VII large subunit